MKTKSIFLSLLVSALLITGCSKKNPGTQKLDIPPVTNPETNTQLTDVFPINESDGLGASNYGFINYSGEVYQGMLNDPSIEKIPAGYVQTKAAFIPEKSIHNTQMFRKEEYRKEMEVIERELKDFLYDFPYEKEVEMDKTF